MEHEPDLRHDVPALFRHLVDNLDADLSEPSEWHFDFRCQDAGRLESLAQSLSEDFDVYFQESVESVDESGHTTEGPPLMSVIFLDAFDQSQVQAHYDSFKSYAANHGLEYEGVSCCEAVDEEEMYGWLDLDSAIWRLRHYSDTGLKPDEYVPYMFAVQPGDLAAGERFIQGARSRPETDAEVIEHEDGPLWAVYIEGKNDDSYLKESYEFVDALAQKHGAELIGVQFFERESEEE